MKKSNFTDEQIVGIVQESALNGLPETACKYRVSEVTVYLWKERFGGLDRQQVGDLRRLEQENARLKKLLAERDLEIEVMKEITSNNCEPVGSISCNPTRSQPRDFPASRLGDVRRNAFDVEL